MEQKQKLTYQDELLAQESVVFIWKAGNVAAAFLALLIGWNGHGAIMLLMFVIQWAYNAKKWPPIAEELERRKKVVAFRQQIENLYVFSSGQVPPGEDTTAAEAFRNTLHWLKESGNEHEVRVHLILYQDVTVFTSYYDKDGRLQSERTWRDKTSARNASGETGKVPYYPASETWEQYLAWREIFVLEDREKRLRQLRSDSRGFEWVNQHYFNQQPFNVV